MKSAQTVCITMPRDFVAKAQKLAARESRTMSELVREALRRYMAEGARSDAAAENRAPEEAAMAARGSDVIHSFRMEKSADKK